MLVQDLNVQLVRPPIPIHRSTAPVRERALALAGHVLSDRLWLVRAV